jgi:hypothetical protein
MAGKPSHRKPRGSRWREVEVRDGLGRACYRLDPVAGAEFGDVTLLRGCGGRGGRSVVRCVCGAQFECDTRALARGAVTRCSGCGSAAGAAKRRRPLGFASQEIDDIWRHRYSGMVSRCYDPSHRAYRNYGGRGIKVHEAWLADRNAFFRHARRLPGSNVLGLDLDRIDNARGYEPGNLRLVSRAANAQNRRGAVLLRAGGRWVSVVDFHREFTPGWRSVNTVRYHLGRGATGDEIVEKYRRGRAGV